MPTSTRSDQGPTTTAPSGPSSLPPTPAGYLFAHFTGEQDADGERIRFALCDGPRPVVWHELQGIPPLAPEGGGARDPFLVRAADGSGFHLIATDLRIHGSEGWEHAVAHGRRSLLVWHSADLRGWEGPHRIEVMPERAGCVWAPEAVWDPTRQEYLVFWASTLYDTDDPGHLRPSYQRMYCASTTDFRTIGAPRTWVDAGYPVIDSTVVEHDGWFYRFSKDERPPGTPDGKFVFLERSRQLDSPGYEPVAQGLGRGVDGVPGLQHSEGPIVLPAPDGRGWLLLLDEFGGRGYTPFHADRLDSRTWKQVTDPAVCTVPPGLRHGSVLPLSETECARLRELIASEA